MTHGWHCYSWKLQWSMPIMASSSQSGNALEAFMTWRHSWRPSPPGPQWSPPKLSHLFSGCRKMRSGNIALQSRWGSLDLCRQGSALSIAPIITKAIISCHWTFNGWGEGCPAVITWAHLSAETLDEVKYSNSSCPQRGAGLKVQKSMSRHPSLCPRHWYFFVVTAATIEHSLEWMMKSSNPTSLTSGRAEWAWMELLNKNQNLVSHAEILDKLRSSNIII